MTVGATNESQFDPEAALEAATPEQRERYHELMRHDPIAGEVFLRSLPLVRAAEDG